MLNFQMEHNDLKTTEDFQRLVDAVNGILCLDSDVEASVVTSTHKKFDQAARMVNDRLKQCDQLLQKGLKAEALQQAKIEPKLLDVVAILDFDEKALWNNYAQQCGFAKIPDLLVDIADDLQTAWADEEPLADLKYRHRLHALARSPLPVRIDILRQLAKADQSNPLWEEELQIYEKARLTDVLEECKAAAASENLEKIMALEAELKSTQWRVPLPTKLVSFASSKSKEIQGKYARAQMAELEPLLNEAYSLSDVETARKLREEWGRHSAVAQLTEKDPLMAKVLEPLKWLAEKDRQDREQAAYHAAVRDLENALDQKDATKADFEPLYYKIEQFGRGIPENLQQRLTIRVEELDLAAARKRRNKQLTIAASIITVLVLIGVGIFAFMQHAQLASHVANLQGLIDDEQLDKAEQYVIDVEASDARVYGHPDFQSLVRRLENEVQADQDRRDQFDRLLLEARKTIEGLSIDDPSSLDPAKTRKGYDALSQAYSGNEDHEQIAKTDMEKARVTELLEELKAKERTVQAAVDDRFRAEVAAFKDELKKLDPDAAGYTAQLSTKESEAQALKATKWISLGLGDQILDPVLSEIEGLIQQDELARAEAGYLAQIRAAIGDPNAYRLQLDSYVNDQRFTGTPRQRQFQQVLQNETALWVGHQDWARLKSDLKGTNLAKYNPKYAPQLVAKATAVLDQHKGFPEETELQGIVEYLNILVVRDQGKLQTAVESVLNQPIVRSLYMLETKGGQKYYSTQPPDAVGTTHFRIRAATDIALSEEKSQQIKVGDIKNPLVAGGQSFDFQSPQMKFSKLAKEKMLALSKDGTTWESDFVELLSELHTNKSMDDFVRFKLIESLETIACTGSLYLAKELQENLDALAKVQDQIDPNANWINPDDEGGKKERLEAADALAKFKDPSDALKGLPAYLDSLKNVNLGPDYEWVGWLHRDRKNQWTVSYAKAPEIKPQAAKLHVLTRSGSAVSYTKIGELKNGQTTISEGDSSSALVEGRPVFEQK